MITIDIIQASKVLKAGGLVAIPTETVYGLGADASNESAVRRIFQVKKRPFHHPLIVHVGSAAQLSDWAQEISDAAWRLAEYFWPGPLTLILKKQSHVLDAVTGGQATIGLRVPNHPVTFKLLRLFGGGVAAPSANEFTRLSPTTAQAVAEELGASIDLILEGGECEVGLESTIIDMTSKQPVILRPGIITAEQIATVLGVPVLSKALTAKIQAPGMHAVHYAPLTKTRVIETEALPELIQAADNQRIALISHFNPSVSLPVNVHFCQMSAAPLIYAHDLYRTLRELDKAGFAEIIILSVPKTPEWDAIRDRLKKAGGRR